MDEVIKALKNIKPGRATGPDEILIELLQGFEQEPIPLMDEVDKALKNIKTGRATGPDEIPFELLQCAGPELRKRLHELIVTIWQTGIWPNDFTLSTLVPLWKKGDPTMCNNYRTLSLVSHASKILLNVLLDRLRGKLEFKAANEQAGFRVGRSTTNRLVKS